MGDFNIAPDDRDVLRPGGLGRPDPLHATRSVRISRACRPGPARRLPAVRAAAQSWSWWDYRNLAFRKNQGLRIDHILVSEALKRARAERAACAIDKLPRKNERPSDHAPVKPQRVRAIGRVRHRGRQTASAEADLVGPDGRLYAHASTTCLVFSGADR
jgi:exonuclease III